MIATADPSIQTSAKTRKRTNAKASARPTAPKSKCTILLSSEADQRLAIHAVMLGLDRSTLVEKLISEHLRQFVVSNRGGCDTVEDRQAGTAA